MTRSTTIIQRHTTPTNSTNHHVVYGVTLHVLHHAIGLRRPPHHQFVTQNTFQKKDTRRFRMFWFRWSCVLYSLLQLWDIGILHRMSCVAHRDVLLGTFLKIPRTDVVTLGERPRTAVCNSWVGWGGAFTSGLVAVIPLFDWSCRWACRFQQAREVDSK